MRLCPAMPVLLLLLLALARATTPGPDGSTPGGPAGSVPPSSPGVWAVGYSDVVSAAVELLNARAVSPYILRLREAPSPPSWLADLQDRQELSFAVEETSCRAPGTATGACKSRWLGAVSWCRGFVFLEQQQPTVELSCEKVPTTDIQLSSLQRLNFTIMETRCPARSGARLDTCEFKEDGLLKDCSAPVPQLGSRPVLDVTCVDSTVDPVRVKRFWPLVPVAIRTVAAGIELYKAIKRK
ncbi:uncharacterized protein LOC141944369 isoform X1 [Strix uralensis]|uniref:uncharacterized protein LOC141944369 isoform X1 n=1 Tax=Strix uralensis TaxID=36305 RepID=UPI003DA2E1FB